MSLLQVSNNFKLEDEISPFKSTNKHQTINPSIDISKISNIANYLVINSYHLSSKITYTIDIIESCNSSIKLVAELLKPVPVVNSVTYHIHHMIDQVCKLRSRVRVGIDIGHWMINNIQMRNVRV